MNWVILIILLILIILTQILILLSKIYLVINVSHIVTIILIGFIQFHFAYNLLFKLVHLLVIDFPVYLKWFLILYFWEIQTLLYLTHFVYLTKITLSWFTIIRCNWHNFILMICLLVVKIIIGKIIKFSLFWWL